jgi:hypothetical protein
VPPDVRQELVALAGSRAFAVWLEEAVSLAFERYEPAEKASEYLNDLTKRFSDVLVHSLRVVGWSDERQSFFRKLVGDGMAAGSDPNLLFRRTAFLMTLVATELSRSLPVGASQEGTRWVAGFASGFLCDLVDELDRCARAAPGQMP